jgi:predicted amidophosphoribosyltransferase
VEVAKVSDEKEKRKCPICGNELNEDEDVCPCCGSLVEEPCYDQMDDEGEE